MSPLIESAPPSTMSPKTPWAPVTGSAPAPASANRRIGSGYERFPLRCTVRLRPVGRSQVAVTVTTRSMTSAETLETYEPLASVSGVSPGLWQASSSAGFLARA